MEVQPPPLAEASAGSQETWDEARLEQGMKRLNLLHIKVRTHDGAARREAMKPLY